MKNILTDAANIGAVTARTIAFKYRGKEAYYYRTARGGCRSSAATSLRARRVMNMDGYIFDDYFADRRHPRHGNECAGKELAISWSVQDSNGNPFLANFSTKSSSTQRAGEGLLVGDRV